MIGDPTLGVQCWAGGDPGSQGQMVSGSILCRIELIPSDARSAALRPRVSKTSLPAPPTSRSAPVPPHLLQEAMRSFITQSWTGLAVGQRPTPRHCLVH